MNKQYVQGAEDVGEVAAEVFKKVAGEVGGLGNQIAENAKKQHQINDALIRFAKKVDYGFFAHALDKMSIEDKTLVISAINGIKKSCDAPSDDALTYYMQLFAVLGVDPLMNFYPDKLSNLTGEDAELTLFLLVEYKAFFTDQSAIQKAEDFAAHINISLKKHRDLAAIVQAAVDEVGINGILSKYEFQAQKQKIKEIEKEIKEKECENDDLRKRIEKDGPNSEPQNTIDLVDNTKMQYSELRRIVGKYFPYVSGAIFSKDTPKKINTFIDKHALLIDKDSMIAFIDTSIFENGTIGLLLTTHAIYYKESFKDIVKVPYAVIDYSKCKLQYDKKGKAKAIDIVQKTGNVLSVDIIGVNSDTMLAMIVDISKLSLNEYAPRDSPMSIQEMDYSVKLSYIKFLVNFLTSSKLSCAELMRFACDLSLAEYELLEVAKYIVDPTESDLELLGQINEYVPYASLKSLRYSLIIEMFRQIQFINHTSAIAALEYESVCKIAKIYNFSDDDIARLKTVAQTEYKILMGEIKSDKELKTVQSALESIALSSGISVTTVVTSSFWLLNAGWLRFIPGIGEILGVIFIGNFIVEAFNAKKTFTKQRDKMITKEKESYKLAIEQLSHLFPGMLSEISLLKKNMNSILYRP